MSTKATILSLLHTLNHAEQDEVSRALKALQGLRGLSSSVVASGQAGSDGDFLIEGIAQYLCEAGVLAGSNRAVYHLQRRGAYKTYKEKRPDLDIFLKKLTGSLGTKGNRHQAQVAFLCASALADMLRARNIFSVGAMLTQIDRVPEALDAAFPEYVESGLFGFILRSSEK